jgi:hypothetical protein
MAGKGKGKGGKGGKVGRQRTNDEEITAISRYIDFMIESQRNSREESKTGRLHIRELKKKTKNDDSPIYDNANELREKMLEFVDKVNEAISVGKECKKLIKNIKNEPEESEFELQSSSIENEEPQSYNEDEPQPLRPMRLDFFIHQQQQQRQQQQQASQQQELNSSDLSNNDVDMIPRINNNSKKLNRCSKNDFEFPHTMNEAHKGLLQTMNNIIRNNTSILAKKGSILHLDKISASEINTLNNYDNEWCSKICFHYNNNGVRISNALKVNKCVICDTAPQNNSLITSFKNGKQVYWDKKYCDGCVEKMKKYI